MCLSVWLIVDLGEEVADIEIVANFGLPQRLVFLTATGRLAPACSYSSYRRRFVWVLLHFIVRGVLGKGPVLIHGQPPPVQVDSPKRQQWTFIDWDVTVFDVLGPSVFRIHWRVEIASHLSSPLHWQSTWEERLVLDLLDSTHFPLQIYSPSCIITRRIPGCPAYQVFEQWWSKERFQFHFLGSVRSTMNESFCLQQWARHLKQCLLQVVQCQRKTKHPWEDCIYCHPRENARRRDLTKHRSDLSLLPYATICVRKPGTDLSWIDELMHI